MVYADKSLKSALPTVYEYNTSDQIGRFSFYHGHKLGRREAYRWLKELAVYKVYYSAITQSLVKRFYQLVVYVG